jgi:hypothetical protein
VFLAEPLADPDALQIRIDDAAEYVRGKTQPGLIYLCEEFLSGKSACPSRW